MSAREKVRATVARIASQSPKSAYGRDVRALGLERATDRDLIMDARMVIDGLSVDLARWNGHPDIQRAVKRARTELDEALDAIDNLTGRRP